MKIIDEKNKIEIAELKEMTKRMYENLVKTVVDVEKEIIAVDAEMHVDLMELLMEKEHSEPKDLWGINLHPDFENENFVEFDSMINLKPAFNNRSRGVDSSELRNRIIKIVDKFVLK